MKIATMLQDIVAALFTKPATEPYPNPTPNEPERLRGRLSWSPDGCTGCQLCVKDCPASALNLFVLDQKAKQFVMRYDESRCTFCGQCVSDCRFSCLKMSPDEWSLAADSKAPFIRYYGDEANVERVLANKAAGDADSAE